MPCAASTAHFAPIAVGELSEVESAFLPVVRPPPCSALLPRQSSWSMLLASYPRQAIKPMLLQASPDVVPCVCLFMCAAHAADAIEQATAGVPPVAHAPVAGLGPKARAAGRAAESLEDRTAAVQRRKKQRLQVGSAQARCICRLCDCRYLQMSTWAAAPGIEFACTRLVDAG